MYLTDPLWLAILNANTIGSGGSSGPSIRGTSANSNPNSATITVSLPAGSLAGDLAVIFATAAFAITNPAGWTNLYTDNAEQWNGLAASKLLSSGDISTGSITVTSASNFDIHAGLAVFVGPVGGVRETEGAPGAGASTQTVTNTTTSAVLATDFGLYWASARGATAPTITPASGIATTQQTLSTTNGKTLFATQHPMPGGALAVGNNFSGVGGASGFMAIQVIVKAS